MHGLTKFLHRSNVSQRSKSQSTDSRSSARYGQKLSGDTDSEITETSKLIQEEKAKSGNV